jgi:hypothetical protein
MADQPKDVYLFDIIGSYVDMTNHCDSQKYYEWEFKVAVPAIQEAGYSLITNEIFRTLESDSFGPLSRGILATKDDKLFMVWYG